MDSLYILNYKTKTKCKCVMRNSNLNCRKQFWDCCSNATHLNSNLPNYDYGCFDSDLLNCFNKYTIYKNCPFMKLIHNNIKVSIYENNKISNVNDFFNILEYLLLWAHKSTNYKTDIRLRTIIMLSICHFMITNKEYIDDIIMFYDRFINQIIILLQTYFIPKKNRHYFIKLFEESFIEDKNICIDQVFCWLYYFQTV